MCELQKKQSLHILTFVSLGSLYFVYESSKPQSLPLLPPWKEYSEIFHGVKTTWFHACYSLDHVMMMSV